MGKQRGVENDAGFPTLPMPEDLANHCWLREEGDDLHGEATLSTDEGIHLVDLFQAPRPAATAFSRETLYLAVGLRSMIGALLAPKGRAAAGELLLQYQAPLVDVIRTSHSCP